MEQTSEPLRVFFNEVYMDHRRRANLRTLDRITFKLKLEGFYDTHKELVARWDYLCAVMTLNLNAEQEQKEATWRYPFKVQLWVWWFAKSFIKRAKEIIRYEETKDAAEQYRLKKYATWEDILKNRKGKPPTVLGKEVLVHFAPQSKGIEFSAYEIWWEIFRGSEDWTGMLRPFVAEQIRYYGDAQKAGSW